MCVEGLFAVFRPFTHFLASQPAWELGCYVFNSLPRYLPIQKAPMRLRPANALPAAGNWAIISIAQTGRLGFAILAHRPTFLDECRVRAGMTLAQPLGPLVAPVTWH